MDQGLPVKSLRTALGIVSYLAKHGRSGLSTVAGDLDIAVSTVHDHLTTLVALGYVQKTDREYHLTTRFLEVGVRTRADLELYQVVGDNLETLATSTEETATLWIEENDRSVIVDIERGSKAIPLAPYPGTRLELHRSAAGKAILAQLSPDRVASILDRYPPGEETERYGIPPRTEHTIDDRDTLYEELDAIREQGFALEDEELVRGVRSVAVPIFDQNERVSGSVGVHGPIRRFSDERYTGTLPDKLREVQNVCELEYRYR